MLLLASLASCWGEARPSVSTDQRSSINKLLSQPPSTLWQKADESLTIIEESLIAQGEPVESLSVSLPELYQKSQELKESVNALSQRFGSLEEYLTSLGNNLTQAILTAKASKAELITWKILAIASVCVTITIAYIRFDH
jgi:peptidoglycan hydrolase CwlO-like protein